MNQNKPGTVEVGAISKAQKNQYDLSSKGLSVKYFHSTRKTQKLNRIGAPGAR